MNKHIGIDPAPGKDETAITFITEEKSKEDLLIETQVSDVLMAAYVLGQSMSEAANDIHKALYRFGEIFSRLVNKNNDPHGWNKTLERTVKKLARRERYLRRYKQRGLRMKSQKTRFHKASHKRF